MARSAGGSIVWQPVDRQSSFQKSSGGSSPSLLTSAATTDIESILEHLSAEERENLDVISKLPGRPLAATLKDLVEKHGHGGSFFDLGTRERKACISDFITCVLLFIQAISWVGAILGANKSRVEEINKELCSDTALCDSLEDNAQLAAERLAQSSPEYRKGIGDAIIITGAERAGGIYDMFTQVINKLNVTERLVNVRRVQLEEAEAGGLRQKDNQDICRLADKSQRQYTSDDVDLIRPSLSLHPGGGLSGGMTVLPLRTEIEHILKKFSLGVIKDKLLCQFPQKQDTMTPDMVLLEDFLKAHPHYVVAHNCCSGMVEVYHIRMTEELTYGMIEQVFSFSHKGPLPSYLRGKRQKFLANKEGLKRHADQDVNPGVSKLRSRDTRYNDVKLGDGPMEKIITQLLAEEGLSGGWWYTLMTGQHPGSSGGTSMGYRSGDLALAVAGLTRISSSDKGKSLRWLEFPDVKLWNDCNLVIGSCLLNNDPTTHQQKSKKFFGKGNRLDVWAHKDSVFWRKVPMWGG